MNASVVGESGDTTARTTGTDGTATFQFSSMSESYDVHVWFGAESWEAASNPEKTTFVVTPQSTTEPSPPPQTRDVRIVGGQNTTFWNGIQFQLKNYGNEPADVTAVEVESVSDPDVVSVSESQTGSYNEGQHEVYIASSTKGVYDADGQPYYNDEGTELPLGSERTMTEPATLQSGETATVSVGVFRNGRSNKVQMNGETIQIRFRVDGEWRSYTVTI